MIGMNIDGYAVKNKNLLITRIRDCNMKSNLVIDDIDLAHTIVNETNTEVTVRRWSLSENEQIEPQEYLNRIKGFDPTHKFRHQVWNEPQFNQSNLDWLTTLSIINRHPSNQHKLTLLNLATGNPTNVDDWPRAEKLLRAISLSPTDRLGLHEYAGGIETSGFYGGLPNEAVLSVNPRITVDLTKIENRPIKWYDEIQDTFLFTAWHCGRYWFCVSFANSKGIDLRGKIDITEHGFDSLNDIQAFMNTFPEKGEGYTTLEYWWNLQGYPNIGGSIYAEKLAYLDSRIYLTPYVKNQYVYVYGEQPGGWWVRFDTEQDSALFNGLRIYQGSGIIPPIPPIPPTQTNDRQALKDTLVMLDADIAKLTITANWIRNYLAKIP